MWSTTTCVNLCGDSKSHFMQRSWIVSGSLDCPHVGTNIRYRAFSKKHKTATFQQQMFCWNRTRVEQHKSDFSSKKHCHIESSIRRFYTLHVLHVMNLAVTKSPSLDYHHICSKFHSICALENSEAYCPWNMRKKGAISVLWHLTHLPVVAIFFVFGGWVRPIMKLRLVLKTQEILTNFKFISSKKNSEEENGLQLKD